MTLRITVHRQGARRRIALAGHLTREELGELERAVEEDRSPALIDLRDLVAADAVGLALLQTLRAEGAELSRVPMHLAWRIEDGGGAEGG